MNRHVKAVAEKALRWSGMPSLSRAVHRNHILILAYHNIVPHGQPIGGDRSLHLGQHEYARQLDWLRRTYDVVPLTAIFQRPPTSGKPTAAITFDDAYRGAVTVGVKELVDRDLPATIFVTPAFIGGTPFWWDLLAVSGNVGLSTEIRQHCVEALDGRHDRVLAWAKSRRIAIRSVLSHQTAATEEELYECMSSGRITFGSHTWSHPNLSRLGSSGDLDTELRKPLQWLKRRFDNVIPWLAYPYGHASGNVAQVATQVGYAGALLVSGGRIPRWKLEECRFCLPRLNIPSGLSFDAFVRLSSGFLSR